MARLPSPRSPAAVLLTACVLLAQAATSHAQGATTGGRWTFTPIYTYSALGRDRGEWNQLDLDLQYKATPRVLLGGNIDWRQRWDSEDTLYTGSVSVQATDSFEWHAAATLASDADFSPERILAAGIEWKPGERMAWLLDYRRLEFADGNLREWRPGVMLWLSDRTWLTARYSDGDAYGARGYYATSVRLDHRFANRQQLSLSYARGVDPERDPLLSGVLLTEADYFSAYYRVPLRSAVDLILGAEYEDRRHVYTRSGLSVGLVVRF